MSDLHFPRKDPGPVSDSTEPITKRSLGDDEPAGWVLTRLDGDMTIPEGPGRWVSDREMEALDALHAGELIRLRGEIHRLKSELAATQAAAQKDADDYERFDAEWEKSYEALSSWCEREHKSAVQWTYACTCGDYDEHRLPGPHDIDTTFATREEAEADAAQWSVEMDGLHYMILRRHVTGWEVA